MARRTDQHLTPDELAGLAAAAGAARPQVPSAGSPEEQTYRHVAQCESCQLLVESCTGDARLRDLTITTSAPRGAQCPPEQDWATLATGLLPEELAEQHMQHATQCDYCGPLLRSATEDLASGLTLEEDALLETLKSQDPDWQHKLARRLAAMSHPHHDQRRSLWTSWLRRPLPMALAGTAVAVIAALFLLLAVPSEKTAERLLAQAYSQQRTMELRISGASYAPIRVERGRSSSRLDHPQALFEAEALISRKLAEHPADPIWLRRKANADLLEGNSDAAMQSLQRALEISPDSPDLFTDLATAYFQRAATQGHDGDYGKAVEFLGRSLARRPDDPVALFNRGIAAERIFLYTQALEDWEHYLRVDPTGPWATEARQRLARLQEKIQRHDQTNNKPLVSPQTVSDQASDPVMILELDARIEEYLHEATRDWLPQAFPLPENPNSLREALAAQSALRVLAQIAQSRHHDDWLNELLSSAASPHYRQAVLSLATALRASDNGDFAATRTHATKAAREFELDGNVAGALRAQAEQVYALHLSHLGAPCYEMARSLDSLLSRKPYSWIGTQLKLEWAVCAEIRGDLDEARILLDQALRKADEAHYGTLYLRGMMLESDVESSAGIAPSAWERDLAGLARYWDGLYPAMRGYSFYSDLDTLASNAQDQHLALAATKQALALLEGTPDLQLLAMAHSRLANAALSAGMPTIAEREFAEASRLFHACPDTDAIRNDQLEAELWLAKLESANADFTASYDRLMRQRHTISRISNEYVAIDYHQTLGQVELRRGNHGEAEKSLGSAIALAEHSLGLLRSEPDRFRWNQQTSPAYRALVESRFRRGDLRGALEFWEWYRAASMRDGSRPVHLRQPSWSGPSSRQFTAASSDASTPTPDVVSHWLGELTEQTVLSYAVFPDGFIVWAFDDRGIAAKWVPEDQHLLAQLTRRYVQMCADPRSSVDALQRDARELSRLLLEPFADKISTRRILIIEADETLASLPFQTLPVSGGRHLVEMASLVFSPGIYFTMATRSANPIKNDAKALVVGAPALPAGVSGLPPLPEASDEAQHIANEFKNARLLLGPQATLPNLRKQLSGVEVFHFAGHAASSGAGLLVAPDTHDGSSPVFLRAETFSATQLGRMNLVVFSACTSDKLAESSFTNPDSLVRVLIRFGVPNVVASRWNVDSVSTTVLMRTLYDHLLSGENVSQAVRAASLTVRSAPGTSHPYYWAAFGVYGRG